MSFPKKAFSDTVVTTYFPSLWITIISGRSGQSHMNYALSSFLRAIRTKPSALFA